MIIPRAHREIGRRAIKNTHPEEAPGTWLGRAGLGCGAAVAAAHAGPKHFVASRPLAPHLSFHEKVSTGPQLRAGMVGQKGARRWVGFPSATISFLQRLFRAQNNHLTATDRTFERAVVPSSRVKGAVSKSVSGRGRFSRKRARPRTESSLDGWTESDRLPLVATSGCGKRSTSQYHSARTRNRPTEGSERVGARDGLPWDHNRGPTQQHDDVSRGCPRLVFPGSNVAVH